MGSIVARYLRSLVFAWAFVLVAAGSAHAAPNIVLVLTDDQRWDTLGAMPTVERELVRRGVTFANAFAVDPLCCPSRASILTGNYPHTTGVWSNGGRRGGWQAFRNEERSTLAVWLQRAGYTTAFLGKYVNSYASTVVPQGWNRWFAFVPSNVPNFVDYELNVDGTIVPSQPGEYSTDVLAAEAVRFIETTPEPFFLLLAPYAPHGPATPAPRHADAFSDVPPWRPPSHAEADVSDKPAYIRARPLPDPAVQAGRDAFRIDQLRSLLAVDDAVANVLGALARGGRLANTVIAYTSDNGHAWGEHRHFAKQAPHEESIRVPLVVRYDALGTGPRTRTEIAANVDLAPTFAELAGAAAPPTEGRSLVPLLGGARAGWRNALLLEHLRGSPSRGVPTYCALRRPTAVYVQYGTGEEELYDLTQDPYQLENRARRPEFRRAIVDYRRRLIRACRPGPPGFRPLPACTKSGTRHANLLLGTQYFDRICAHAGDDYIAARGEHDVVRAGSGRDRILAGAGNDRIFAADRFRDRVACGAGTDSALVDRRDVVSGCELVTRR
jgi:N-acetylglucosamine-6-sulfatase